MLFLLKKKKKKVKIFLFVHHSLGGIYKKPGRLRWVMSWETIIQSGPLINLITDKQNTWYNNLEPM